MRALGDINIAKTALRKRTDDPDLAGIYVDNSAYHAEQAVEKCLKYILHFEHDVKIDRKFKTHRIEELMERVEDFEPDFENAHEALWEISFELSMWEAETRYSGVICCEKWEAKKALKLAESLFDETMERWKQRFDAKEALAPS